MITALLVSLALVVIGCGVVAALHASAGKRERREMRRHVGGPWQWWGR